MGATVPTMALGQCHLGYTQVREAMCLRRSLLGHEVVCGAGQVGGSPALPEVLTHTTTMELFLHARVRGCIH